jgi:hypothetical protein
VAIVNVIDRRKRSYRSRNVQAIVEAAWHNNFCKDADQYPRPPDVDGPHYDAKMGSVEEVIAWANSFPQAVVMYLYDEDADNYPFSGRSSAA